MRLRFVIGVMLLLFGLNTIGHAIEFYFEPDTVNGDIGETVWLSGRLDSTQFMRGYTVYMSYDTNFVDLYEPPVAGSLIAGHAGLQFHYFDHAPFEPDLLEIGATIFGNDFWHGPGEIFRARFILRQCGSLSIDAPYPPFFVASDNSFPTVNYHSALISICLAPPLPINNLTIFSSNLTSVILHWSSVNSDTNGQILPFPPVYNIFRQQFQPSVLPIVEIATTSDTFYTDNFESGTEYLYYITVQSNP